MDADVIIGGGGFVGMSLALALARQGLEVVVIDPVTADAALTERFDGRVSALSYASLRMFRALGVWEGLALHAQPIEQILVTDAKLGRPASLFSLHFDGGEIGGPLGVIAENRAIRHALYTAVAAVAEIRVIAPASVASLTADGSAITVRLSSGEVLSARLAVASDGRESHARDEMGQSDFAEMTMSGPDRGRPNTARRVAPPMRRDSWGLSESPGRR